MQKDPTIFQYIAYIVLIAFFVPLSIFEWFHAKGVRLRIVLTLLPGLIVARSALKLKVEKGDPREVELLRSEFAKLIETLDNSFANEREIAWVKAYLS